MSFLVGLKRIRAKPGLLPPGVLVRDGEIKLVVDEWFYRARGCRPALEALPTVDAAQTDAANENRTHDGRNAGGRQHS